MLEKLKEYKELMAIIVFFLGGFIWINNQFPTKSDLSAEKSDLSAENGSLNCLVKKYMSLTQLQIRGQELVKQMQDLATTITDMETNSENVLLSPAMLFELDQLKADLGHDTEKFRSNKAEIKNIMDELARNVCRKVTK